MAEHGGGRGESAGDKAREEFFSEAQEIVDGLSRDLLALDDVSRRGGTDAELVNDVFRAVHTLKGLSGLFGAAMMSGLSHELENLLDDLRLGRIELTPQVLWNIERGIGISAAQIMEAEQERSRIHRNFIAFFEQHDFLLLPLMLVLLQMAQQLYGHERVMPDDASDVTCTGIGLLFSQCCQIVGSFTQYGNFHFTEKLSPFSQFAKIFRLYRHLLYPS